MKMNVKKKRVLWIQSVFCSEYCMILTGIYEVEVVTRIVGFFADIVDDRCEQFRSGFNTTASRRWNLHQKRSVWI